MPEHIIVYTDGGSRGNPGPGAAAYILVDKNHNRLQAKGYFLGTTTNNIAEYTALIKGLQAAKQRQADSVVALSDSELLVRQINGEYRIKSPHLRTLHRESLELLDEFSQWEVKHILREQNKEADDFVNRAINLQRDVETKGGRPAGPGKPLRLGVLISGGGTTLLNINKEVDAGRLNAQIAVVISSRRVVKGVDRARKMGLNVEFVRKKDFADIGQFSNRIAEVLDGARVDLVIQAGWLCLWHIPQKYTNRVMNIHPALLPSFGGEGMWGHHVHEAVLKAGCKVSGCTVHFCTNEYDKGPIIVQRCCEVKDNDTPEALAARVFEQECIAYPEAIRLFGQGRLSVQDNIVRVKQ